MEKKDKLKKYKKGYRKESNPIFYYLLGIVIFFIGVLLIYKPAYDYTLIKNMAGFIFCFLISVYYFLTNKEFELSKNFYFPFAFFIWLLISSFYAPYKFESAKSFENYLLYFLIFVITSNLEIKKEVFYTWIFAGFIAVIKGLIDQYGERNYAISTFGNPNFFAGHLIMILSLCFSNILNHRNIFKKENEICVLLKMLDYLCLFFGLWALYVAKSRAAFMGFLIGTGFLWYFQNYEKTGFEKYIGIFGVIVVVFFLFPQILNWFEKDIRYFIWRGTWRLILKKPWIGWGLGNFIFFYPYYRIREYFLREESTPITNHPHNEYLEIWAETGVIGVFLFLSTIFFLILRRSKIKEKETDYFLPGVLGGIIGVLCDNIFSTNLRNPSTSMYFWFLIGILVQFSRKEKVNLNFSKILYGVIIFVSFFMGIFHPYRRILPQVYYKNGVIEKEIGNYEKSIDYYSKGCKLDHYNYELWYKLAYVYGMANDYEKSKTVYLYINNVLFPHYAKTDANLGTVYMKLGDIETAFKYYKKFEFFNPYDEDVLSSIASIYIVYYNNIEEGVKYLKRILKKNPNNVYAKRVFYLLKKEGKIKNKDE